MLLISYLILVKLLAQEQILILGTYTKLILGIIYIHTTQNSRFLRMCTWEDEGKQYECERSRVLIQFNFNLHCHPTLIFFTTI